ncbi:SpoIVB peptidase S55 domain-containing protein [Granulicella sp. dw_53]|uniref:SpoIVB peptidase S55 domain-containing protein n=1 Tax=Granulicella sp. dw_53 TaxID=2719792 RepID=UPI0021064C2B|nr:SpoIVB peptidase S55 domain-containing protein [Granulicella sp. dw_53]
MQGLTLAMSLTLPGGIWAQAPSGIAGVAAAAMGSMPVAAPLETRIFPLSEVKRGLRGVAYTVFEGVVPEPMEVEILGVLKDSLGPGQDMILARLRGTKPEYTGVVAGMSGSPVYIDGRLVGALSYRIGQFSRDPIAGITPIELMLAVRDGVGVGGGKVDLSTPLQGDGPRDARKVSGAGGAEMQPIETPLVFGSGFGRETVERFGDRFRAMGLTPVAGLGGADTKAVQPEPLVPGSAVSAVLVRGDLSMAGTCTVTYIDPKRLLACGHPITQYGPVALPMTKAEVVATLASPLNAFKIINTTETVGSFTEDRASAILGRFDVNARMIPVTVEVIPPDGGQAKTFKFEVVDNRQLTPSAMLVSVYQSLQGTNVSAAEMSYRVRGEMTVAGQAPVRISGLMAQNDLNSGAINTALLVGDRFNRVYDNALDQPKITGVRLRVETISERKTASLEAARLSKTEARAGDTVEVEATLRPYQSEARVTKIRFTLPANLQPGPLRVVVSDGATVDRLLSAPGGGSQRAMGLTDTVAQLNRNHANDVVYVTLLDKAAQAVLESGALGEVPLSMANVLGPLKEGQKMQLTGESVVEVGSAPADYAVSGSQVLTIAIR